MNAQAATLKRRAATASVATALFLGILKAVAAWKTGSIAMLASLADSGLDLVASLVTLFGVHVASQPADDDHRFGHGKAEALAALFQVMIITGSAIFILIRAVQRFSEGAVSADAEYGIAVSVIAIVVTLALTRYQAYVLSRTTSLAIGTDNLHYKSDLFLNLSVILALVLEQYAGLTGADPVLGIAIALWLLYGAWSASVHAINELMDREWPEEKRRHFIEVASRHPELKGMHDLRTRTSGDRDFVQFHIWVAPHATVREAHDIMDSIEALLAKEFPETEVLIHVDPEGLVDEGARFAKVDEVTALDDEHGEAKPA
ncbi:cation diffusion facilitator family transporter [Stakelama sediminis]|uniref:Ferrous-iron efflux pump FieF n=1 Tax=Stakelama sediminis TaxID=463200 RepID=A0A840YXL1_9SPHN|nr:ferrous-iron efflux pump FieF [Stakelama sediminis]